MTEKRAPAFSEWSEWLAKHHTDPALPKNIQKMHRKYGRNAGAACKTCKFLCGYRYHNKVYYKCQKFGVTHGAAMDWRLKNAACGKYEGGGE